MASTSSNQYPLADAPVINPSQLGGIETSVLDDGPGRGVRIAWVNTGGGLRYKVVLDRGLDIADAEFVGQSLTWHGYSGIVAPSHGYNRKLEWLRTFFGGLLVSCGPLNTGAPFVEDDQEYNIHGTHSHTRANIESIVNPDPARGKYDMRIVGVVRTARLFNPNVELRRTIAGTLGEPSIRIHDVFLNRGNEPVPHAWLLHINFGYPLLEPGESVYCYRGAVSPIEPGAAWFDRDDYKTAPPPLDAHRGAGEAFAYVDAEADADGTVTVGVVNRARGFGVKIAYPRAAFPRMGNWQHWGPSGEYVGALEPMTASVEGWQADRERGWHRTLAPGEQVEYHCTITATDSTDELDRLLQLNT